MKLRDIKPGQVFRIGNRGRVQRRAAVTEGVAARMVPKILTIDDKTGEIDWWYADTEVYPVETFGEVKVGELFETEGVLYMRGVSVLAAVDHTTSADLSPNLEVKRV